MADDLDDAMSGLDAPRPLPPHLRGRLEQRLSHDAVALLLADVDGPRPLPTGLRERLERDLVARRTGSGWRRAVVGLSAAAAVALIAVAVGRTGGGEGPTQVAGGSPSPPAAGTSTASGAVGGSGASGGIRSGTGSTGRGQALTSAPAPSAPTVVGGAGSALSDNAATAAGIDRASPAAGPLAGGTTVTIHGRGLAATRSVDFGAVPARSFHVVSDTTLTAVTPAVPSARTVDIYVTLAAGTRFGLSPGFSYLPVPVVTSVSPGSGPTGGGTWVTIDGSALARASEVRFGDAPAVRIVLVSDTRLRALTQAHPAGRVDVTVTTPGGTSAASARDGYVYLP